MMGPVVRKKKVYHGATFRPSVTAVGDKSSRPETKERSHLTTRC